MEEYMNEFGLTDAEVAEYNEYLDAQYDDEFESLYEADELDALEAQVAFQNAYEKGLLG